ncbi:hypothetical protein METHP14_650015 [Pseudomonas sp. P14-2025]
MAGSFWLEDNGGMDVCETSR